MRYENAQEETFLNSINKDYTLKLSTIFGNTPSNADANMLVLGVLTELSKKDIIYPGFKELDDEEKFIIAKKSIKYFTSNYDCLTVDGVRIKFSDGWGLVRASNTQPVIVCRFEANKKEVLDKYISLVLNKIFWVELL